MTKSSRDARDRAMLAMNQRWHSIASKLIDDAKSEMGTAFNCGHAELISESMLTVSIGYELQAKGFRRLSLDLNKIAKNFARLADQLDDQDDIDAHLAGGKNGAVLKNPTLN